MHSWCFVTISLQVSMCTLLKCVHHCLPTGCMYWYSCKPTSLCDKMVQVNVCSTCTWVQAWLPPSHNGCELVHNISRFLLEQSELSVLVLSLKPINSELNIPLKGPAYPTEKRNGCNCRAKSGGLASLIPIIQSYFPLIKNPADHDQQDLLYCWGKEHTNLGLPISCQVINGGIWTGPMSVLFKVDSETFGLRFPSASENQHGGRIGWACISCLLLKVASLSFFCCSWLNQVSIYHFLTTSLPSQYFTSATMQPPVKCGRLAWHY